MKKLISLLALISILSVLFAGCTNQGSTSKSPPSNLPSDNITTPPPQEPTTNGGNSDGQESIDEDDRESDLELTVNSEQMLQFIDTVYEFAPADFLPEQFDQYSIDITDPNALFENTGLDRSDGISEVVVSKSTDPVDTFLLVYLATEEDAAIEEIQISLLESVNFSPLLPAPAGRTISVTLDGGIFLIAADIEQAEAVYGAVLQAADGVFTVIGDRFEQ